VVVGDEGFETMPPNVGVPVLSLSTEYREAEDVVSQFPQSTVSPMSERKQSKLRGIFRKDSKADAGRPHSKFKSTYLRFSTDKWE
jgi:hypothetical protein